MSAPTMMPRELVELLAGVAASLTSLQTTTVLELPVQSVHLTLQLALRGVAEEMGVPAPPAPARPPARRRRPARPPRPRPAPAEPARSAWDPDGPDDRRESERYRALLLEVVRRAAHDWVLYRQHERLLLKQTAEDAYIWLFEEQPGHPWWLERQRDGRAITGFLTICEVLDLDPETVRARVRQMDVRTIIGAGRPPETRRRRANEELEYDEHSVEAGVDVMSMGDDPHQSSYENYFSVDTPGYQ